MEEKESDGEITIGATDLRFPGLGALAIYTSMVVGDYAMPEGSEAHDASIREMVMDFGVHNIWCMPKNVVYTKVHGVHNLWCTQRFLVCIIFGARQKNVVYTKVHGVHNIWCMPKNVWGA